MSGDASKIWSRVHGSREIGFVGSRQRGESLKGIGRAFGKPSWSIYFQLVPHGGIRPLPRRRSRLALTLLEREAISRGIVAQQSMRSMARLLGRPASTAWPSAWSIMSTNCRLLRLKYCRAWSGWAAGRPRRMEGAHPWLQDPWRRYRNGISRDRRVRASNGVVAAPPTARRVIIGIGGNGSHPMAPSP